MVLATHLCPDSVASVIVGNALGIKPLSQEMKIRGLSIFQDQRAASVLTQFRGSQKAPGNEPCCNQPLFPRKETLALFDPDRTGRVSVQNFLLLSCTSWLCRNWFS